MTLSLLYSLHLALLLHETMTNSVVYNYDIVYLMFFTFSSFLSVNLYVFATLLSWFLNIINICCLLMLFSLRCSYLKMATFPSSIKRVHCALCSIYTAKKALTSMTSLCHVWVRFDNPLWVMMHNKCMWFALIISF